MIIIGIRYRLFQNTLNRGGGGDERALFNQKSWASGSEK